MNNYNFIKSIPYETYLSLIQRGIIPIHIMDYVLIYETYLIDLEKNKKSVSITYCAEKFNKHENSIRNIIKFMTL